MSIPFPNGLRNTRLKSGSHLTALGLFCDLTVLERYGNNPEDTPREKSFALDGVIIYSEYGHKLDLNNFQKMWERNLENAVTVTKVRGRGVAAAKSRLFRRSPFQIADAIVLDDV